MPRKRRVEKIPAPEPEPQPQPPVDVVNAITLEDIEAHHVQRSPSPKLPDRNGNDNDKNDDGHESEEDEEKKWAHFSPRLRTIRKMERTMRWMATLHPDEVRLIKKGTDGWRKEQLDLLKAMRKSKRDYGDHLAGIVRKEAELHDFNVCLECRLCFNAHEEDSSHPRTFFLCNDWRVVKRHLMKHRLADVKQFREHHAAVVTVCGKPFDLAERPFMPSEWFGPGIIVRDITGTGGNVGVLLMPHPDTHQLRLERGREYDLVRFVGEQLIRVVDHTTQDIDHYLATLERSSLSACWNQLKHTSASAEYSRLRRRTSVHLMPSWDTLHKDEQRDLKLRTERRKEELTSHLQHLMSKTKPIGVDAEPGVVMKQRRKREGWLNPYLLARKE